MNTTAVLCVFAAIVATVAAMGGLQQPPKTSPRRLGFTEPTFAVERGHERRLAASLSPSSISEVHRMLTRRPHRAGTPGSREVVSYISDELRRAGLEVEVIEYLPYLSAPGQARLEITAPTHVRLVTMEPADSRDPTSSHEELDPGFIAYSPSGDVTAAVVFANYGLPADYEQLAASGVDVRGRIVLVRYGRSHRAVKVFTAERAGAAAVLLYSDPADDGAGRGAVWPNGMWRAPHFIQRGNAKYSWFWHGDPLTPGQAATATAEALDPKTVPTLPTIPVMVLSASEAQKVLALLPGDVTLRLHLEMRNARTSIQNVIARIPGRSPERVIMLGTHHDAWTFGGIDPGSSAAVILDLARRLAALRHSGWQPIRTLDFAFWDAEEYGLIGSTEFAEDRAPVLQERTAVYINSDMYTRGRFVAGGVPSLRDFVAELAGDLGIPIRPELSALGSGADFVAFQDHLGIPTLTLEYLFEGGYGFGAYHSSYDSRSYMEHVADPGFTQAVALAEVLGIAVMRLASSPILPFRHSTYADRIRTYLQETKGVDTTELQALATAIAGRARRVEEAIDAELAGGRVPANAAAINDALARVDQALLDRTEPADRRWYRHVIYGWNIYSMYDGQPLPGLFEAIRVENQAATIAERARVRAALERMQQSIETLVVLADAR